MSPSHRAGPPGGPGMPDDAALPDDPDGSAPPPPEPDDLDRLVDRLAAEHPSEAAEATGTDPGGAGGVLLADEVTTAVGHLDELRASILRTSADLSDDQGTARMLGSPTTVTGILRHLAEMERYWFREIVGSVPQEEVGYRWGRPADGEAAWDVEAGASLEQARADYESSCTSSRAQMHGRPPDEEQRGPREVRTLRWVLVHMVQETARHAGHLDVIVELLDGRTGR